MITLELGERSALFRDDGRPVAAPLPLGPTLLRERWLRHDPPQPQELEAAIEAVEDLVMPLHGRWAATDTLQVTATDASLQGIVALDPSFTRDQLEELFNRSAAIVLGRPASKDPALAEPGVIAGLLILREVMHHLGFTQLRLQPMVMTRALGNWANGS